MIPAFPRSLERTLISAITRRRASTEGQERWALLNASQAETLARLLTTHTAEQWSRATGQAIDAPMLAGVRAQVEVELRRILDAEADEVPRHPKLIARDLVTQGRMMLTREAARLAGVRRFRWRTQRDSRVREAHKSIDGNVYDFTTGAPGEGLPGEPWGCRCSAEPVL